MVKECKKTLEREKRLRKKQNVMRMKMFVEDFNSLKKGTYVYRELFGNNKKIGSEKEIKEDD